MAEDNVNFKGVTSEYKDDRGKAVTIPSAVLGIVKNNVDPTYTGRLEVYLNRMGASDPDNPAYWTTVRYLSPFFGNTPNTGNQDGYGDYIGNPNSYGFWATPPDIGSEVICIFLNGDPNEGYYIGGVPQPGLTHMVPGIGATDKIILNKGEAKSYGESKRLPVSEYNNANSKQSNSIRQTDNPRPVHSYQAAIYNKQGLLRDPDRGPISSSSMRETPSRVFGMSTPGRPIYQGGFTDETIGQAASDINSNPSAFQVVGRRGGHTFVLDDGTYDGRDNLVRLRTAGGHTILMNDSAQTLFIIHSNGQSYIELGKEGTIDMYATNSVNIRTQGDLNLHADRNVNIQAKENFSVNAKNVQIESEQDTRQFVGGNFYQYIKKDHTNKVEGGMSFESTGPASIASTGSKIVYVTGEKAVNLNTGSTSLIPDIIKQLPKFLQTDTLYDVEKGFAAAPGKLSTITSRTPAHSPWADANKGVDVKTDLSADANLPEPPSDTVSQVNNSVPASPKSPTNSTLVNTVPSTGGSNPGNATTSKSLTSAMAVQAQTGPAQDVIKQTGGIVEKDGKVTAVLGATGLTPAQLEQAGILKPGMQTAIQKALDQGKPLSEAIPSNAFTGKDGINTLESFLGNKNAQVNVSKDLLDKSKNSLIQNGIITGKEDPAQTSGLVLATANLGPETVSSFVKNIKAAEAGPKPQNVQEATALLGKIVPIDPAMQKTGVDLANSLISTAKPTAGISGALQGGVLNSLNGSPQDLISAGKLAGSLANKSLSGLPSTPDANIIGTVGGLFKKIVSTFKPMEAGKPISLQSVNAKNEAERTAQSIAQSPTPTVVDPAIKDAVQARIAQDTKITSTLNSVEGVSSIIGTFNPTFGSQIKSAYDIAKKAGEEAKASQQSVGSAPSAPNSANDASGLSNLPGGAQSVARNIQGDFASGVPGTASVKDTLSKITGSTTGPFPQLGGTIDNLKGKLGPGNNLSGLVSQGLSQNDISQLNGAIGSISTPAQEFKLPTTAEGTNSFSGLIAQSKNLIGNDKVPPLVFGGFKPRQLSPTEVAKYDKLKAEKEKLEDLQWDLKKDAYNAAQKYGGNSPQALEAKQKYEQALVEIERLKQELYKLTVG